jgi:hypothetical protein
MTTLWMKRVLVVLGMNLFFVTDLTDFSGFYLIELTAMRFLRNDNFVNFKNQYQYQYQKSISISISKINFLNHKLAQI